MKIKDIKLNPDNPRIIKDRRFKKLVQSLKEFPKMLELRPIVINEHNEVLGGNMRLKALKELGYKEIPDSWVKRADKLTEDEKRRFIIEDNIEFGENDWDILSKDWDKTEITDWGMELPNVINENSEINYGSLKEKFGIAPFSVFNSREAWWRERRRAWLEIGIKSELGRGDKLTINVDAMRKYGRNINKLSGTSIFDPVLCELLYEWFSPKKGIILDPFAGGSVRGIVASKKGREYIGIDLSKEQINNNIEQVNIICNNIKPQYFIGDSNDVLKTFKDIKVDFILSCPPYFDLEKYSNNFKDLSNMNYEDFIKNYYNIIKNSCALLNNDSFACFVVGDIRDRKGNYKNFISDTIKGFLLAGLTLYNEAVLLNSTGTLAIRAGRYFKTSRKLGKTHQNVLIFLKGDSKKAVEKLGNCEFMDVNTLDVEED